MRVRKNSSKPFNLTLAFATEEAMNNKTERFSTGVVPEDKRAQQNVACEPLQKMLLAEEASREAPIEILDHLFNFPGKRLKDYNEEPSTIDKQKGLPNPSQRTGKADPRDMCFMRQRSSSLTPTTVQSADPTSTSTGTQEQQQRQDQQQLQLQHQRSNTDVRLSSPWKGPSGMPTEKPANLRSAGSPHNGSYALLLQREIRRISADRKKMRHEMERFQSSVSALQSQIEQRRRYIEALKRENEALRKENEALRKIAPDC